MATAPEVVPYLVRRGIEADATDSKTLVVDGVSIPLPINSRQYRAIDLANYVIRDMKKLKARHAAPAPATPTPPAPVATPEVTPEPVETPVDPALDDAAPVALDEISLLGMSHRELDVHLGAFGLATHGSKADKVARISEHLQAHATGDVNEE